MELKNNYKIFLLLLLIAGQANADLAIEPNVFNSGRSTSVKIKDNNQDVTSDYNVSYTDSDPSFKEVEISNFRSKPVLLGITAGNNYKIVATKKDGSYSQDLFINVIPGQASKIFSLNSNFTIQALTTTSVSVLIKDQKNNPVPGAVVNWSTSSPNSLLSPTSVTDSLGIAQNTISAGNIIGRYQINAQVLNSVSTKIQFYVAPELALDQKLKINSRPDFIKVGQNFSISVNILDEQENIFIQFYNPVTISAYKDKFCSSTPSNSLLGTKARNPLNGTVIFNDLNYGAEEEIYLKISSPGVPSLCSTKINAYHDNASKLTFFSKPVAGNTNTQLFPNVGIKIQDNLDRIIRHANNEVTMELYEDSSCQNQSPYDFNGTKNKSASVGYAVFRNLTIPVAGTYYLKASSPGLASACSSAVTITGQSNNVYCRQGYDKINNQCILSCSLPQVRSITSNECVDSTIDCSSEIINSLLATKTFNVLSNSYGSCTLLSCSSGYMISSNQCIAINPLEEQIIGLSSFISAGRETSFIRKTDGALIGSGDNTYKQLGTFALTNSSSFVSVSSPDEFVDIKAGPVNVYGIKSSGILYGWGYNITGDLGSGSSSANKASPTQISFPSGVTVKGITHGMGTNFSNSASFSGGAIDVLTEEMYLWGYSYSGNTGVSLGIDGASQSPVYFSGNQIKNVAAINKTTSSAESTVKLPTFNAQIRDFAFDGQNTLFVGGDFTSVDNQTRNRIVKLIRVKNSWVLDPVFNQNSANVGFNNSVYKILVDGEFIYAVGYFTSYTDNLGVSTTRPSIVRISKTNGSITSFNAGCYNGAGQGLNAAVIEGNYIYIAGSQNVGNQGSGYHIGKMDKVTGALSSDWPSFRQQNTSTTFSTFIHDMAIQNGYLYLAGQFSSIRNGPLNTNSDPIYTKNNLFRINLSNNSIDNNFTPPWTTSGSTAFIKDIEFTPDGNIIAVGTFNDLVITGRNVVKINAATGLRMDDFNAGNSVFALSGSYVNKAIISGESLFLLGKFTGQSLISDPIGSVNIAKLSLAGSPDLTTFLSKNQSVASTDFLVSGIVDGDNLYIGGSFTKWGDYHRKWLQVAQGPAAVAIEKTTGQLYWWGKGATISPTPINDGRIYRFVAPAADLQIHTDTSALAYFAIEESTDKLYAWNPVPVANANNPSVLGDGTTIVSANPKLIASDKTWSTVCAGVKFAIAIEKETGNIYSWGINTKGQLGSNDLNSKTVPTQINSNKVFAEISCGRNFAIAREKDTGIIYGWGDTSKGQLGYVSVNPVISPIEIGTIAP